MEDKEKFGLLMKESKSTLANALIRVGNEITELNKKLDNALAKKEVVGGGK